MFCKFLCPPCALMIPPVSTLPCPAADRGISGLLGVLKQLKGIVLGAPPQGLMLSTGKKMVLFFEMRKITSLSTGKDGYVR